MNTTQAAAITGTTRQTVAAWCRAGHIPGATKEGGRDWRIPDDTNWDTVRANVPHVGRPAQATAAPEQGAGGGGQEEEAPCQS